MSSNLACAREKETERVTGGETVATLGLLSSFKTVWFTLGWHRLKP